MTAVMIFNAVVVIAFSVLAYVFNKWWIVLFAVFCLMRYERKENGE